MTNLFYIARITGVLSSSDMSKHLGKEKLAYRIESNSIRMSPELARELRRYITHRLADFPSSGDMDLPGPLAEVYQLKRQILKDLRKCLKQSLD